MQRTLQYLTGLVAFMALGSLADIRETSESHFVPYGIDEGDKLLNLADDGTSEQIDLGFMFPFSNRIRNHLFVSNNGLISFRRAYRSFDAVVFPLCQRQEVIAAFWADVRAMPTTPAQQQDPTYDGPGVFIRQVDVSSPEVLERLTADVLTEFPEEITNFQAIYAFIATWRQTSVYEGDDTEHNTFQAVLITNGRHSFVELNYGELTWSNVQDSSSNHAVIGFNARGCRSNPHYHMITGSGTPDVMEVSGNRFVFRIDTRQIEDGGCNTAGAIRLNPHFTTPLGGTITTITGPCIAPDDDIVATFNHVRGECEATQIFSDESRDESREHVYGVRCRVPVSLALGRVSVRLSLDGGTTFQHAGKLNIVPNITRYDVTSLDLLNTLDPVSIAWDATLFDGCSELVDVYLMYFNEEDKFFTPEYLPLLLNAPNNGSTSLPWRLPEIQLQDIQAPRAGIIEVRAASDSICPRVHSSMHLLDWYRRSVIREIATQSIFNTRRKRQAPEMHDSFQGTYDVVDEMLGGLRERMEEALRDAEEEVEDELEVLEETLRELENDGEFDIIIEEAFPNECDAFLEEALESNEIFLNPPPVPCLQGQARDDAGYRPNNIYDSTDFMTQRLHGDSVIECYISEIFGDGSSNQACYDTINHLVTDSEPLQTHGGSVLYAHPDGAYSYSRQDDLLMIQRQYLVPYFYNDLIPLYECCVLGGDCIGYYVERPFDDCSNYPEEESTITYGDPRIVTLDGVSYLFNGIGEYTVFEVEGGDFTIQGRTVQSTDAITDDPIRASNWQAFVMATSQSDSIQVEASEVRNLTIYINDEMEEFDVNNTLIYFNGGRISFHENTTYVNFTSSRISVRITNVEQTLQFMLIVPQEYKGRTRGLLGTWNDDPSDDFTNAMGEVISNEATEEEIHYSFGETYRTTPDTSMFFYEEDLMHEDFQMEDFVPLFQTPDIFSSDDLHEFCNGDEQCMYDYKMTGNERIAEGSKNFTEDFRNVTDHLRSVTTCGFIDVPKNGKVSMMGYVVGDEVHFRCNGGYHLHGSTVRTCRPNGQWDGELTTCSKDAVDPLIWSNIITGLVVFILCCSVFFTVHMCKKRNQQTSTTIRQPAMFPEKPCEVKISTIGQPPTYNETHTKA